MIDLIIKYMGSIGSSEMDIMRESHDFKYCYIFSVMFAKRSAAFKKICIIFLFIYIGTFLLEKMTTHTYKWNDNFFYRSGFARSIIVSIRYSRSSVKKIGRIDFLLSSLAENRMVNRRGRFAMDESNGRELARLSGRVTLKISSLLLKPDFFLVILSELRRPLRSVRFFCRFCNI